MELKLFEKKCMVCNEKAIARTSLGGISVCKVCFETYAQLAKQFEYQLSHLRSKFIQNLISNIKKSRTKGNSNLPDGSNGD